MRRDIQFLRGVAVLLVVIYHAGLGIFDRGYLGVDVFFVISGFLITKIILQGLDSGTFSFTGFYLRRAKRLLPALYSTLFVTAVFSYWMLAPGQLVDFFKQFVGAVTFSSNIILPMQISYFADGAETKPLLHIWSLSLEEQYYFAIPFLLFLVSRRWRPVILVAALLASLAWCISWVSAAGVPPFLWRFGQASISDWAFFLFPTRAWELLAGSVCAWIILNCRPLTIWPSVKWASLMVIFIVAIWGIDDPHPRGDAIVVVLATMLLVLGNDDWLPSAGLIRAVEKIGDWSYSIYLVHWPIFVFAYLGFAEQVPAVIKVPLVAMAIGIGYLQYRVIEQPFRYHWHHPNHFLWRRIAASSLVLLLVPFGIVGYSGWASGVQGESEHFRRINHGLSSDCANSFHGDAIKRGCFHGGAPNLAVWGDSYAMHLVPGLSQSNENLVQLTKSSCGPVIDLAPISTGQYNQAWAKECIEHNNQSMRFIEETDTITHVVISSAFDQYFGDGDRVFFLEDRVIIGGPELAREHLAETIERLKSAGKTPILVSPPPRAGFNIGICLEREDLGLLLFRDSCDVKLEKYLRRDRAVIDALSQVANETEVSIVWLKDYLCVADSCSTRLNGTYIYRDGGHLSVEGSIELLGSMRIGRATADDLVF